MDDDPSAVGVIGYFLHGLPAMKEGMRDRIREVDIVLLVGKRANANGTAGWTVFPNDWTLPAPTRVALDVLTPPRLSADHTLGQLPASPGSATRRRLNRGRLSRVNIMTIADVDYFRQKIAGIGIGIGIGADSRYAFELPQAPDFVLEGRFRFAADAVGRAVLG